MPTLDQAQLEGLNRRPVRICEHCGRAVRANYCRECDEFFESGHMGGRPGCDATHDSHRTY